MGHSSARILPMKTAGTHHFIERTYREGGAFQWVRETLTNAIEAKATRIEFGIEWQAVEQLGVYRRVIADNGQGMTADELVAFFNTFGGGGKPIGGVHENFGVGSKTSLLPWNHYGMVVISWVDGDASMLWVQKDPDTDEYGLRLVECEEPESDKVSLEVVYEPFEDEEHGCDWLLVKPEWIKKHGTVIVLLGNGANDDTILGDQNRNESDIKGISSYLNRRLWQLPKGITIFVDELRTGDRTKWPRSEGEGHGPQPKKGYDRRTNLRSIQGAKFFIEYPVPTFKKHGKIGASGTVSLSDGTAVDWWLWDGERPSVQSYASIGGFIGALYRDELYDVTAHTATYRSFGISEGSVRTKLWLIVRPPLLDESGKAGVYPRTDRNALLLKGGPSAGEPLPMNDWGAEFADLMPEEIRSAIKAARTGDVGTIQDPSWRERLADRFGSRWRITKLRTHQSGTLSVAPTHAGTQPRHQRPVLKKNRSQTRSSGGGSTTRSRGQLHTGTVAGPMAARKVRIGGGIPQYRPVKADSVGEGMLAAWQPNDPEYPEGVVLLNVEHPVLSAEIEHWQAQYPDHYADDIARDVIDVYGQIAVSKVAHSEHLKGILPSKIVDDELRSDAALTMSLLGLLAEEAVIATRIGGKYGRRRAVS